MRTAVRMPHYSSDTVDGRVMKWLKEVGDPVQRGEAIAEVETDKAVMDLEAPAGGMLAEIIHREGAEVPAGEPIAWIDAP
jgi:pyruvate dehydrogenase E2 component (dihydrolipoamide acetyltransferase)